MAKINPVKVKQDADKLEKAGRLDQAIALYKQIVEDNPRDWNTINKIGDLFAKLNKPKEASDEYAKVADFYAKDGFLLKAIAIWKKINKLDASSLEPYLNLADLYAKQGLMMEAKGQYQIVVDEYIKRGKMREAGEILKKMVDIDPADLKIRSKLPDLYMREGNLAKAVEEHIAIAEELNKKGHLAEALQVLEKGLKIDGKSSRLRTELARIHLLQKNWDKAVHFLEEAVQLSPNDTQILARLGEAYIGSKKIEEAEAIFKRLLELDPRDDDSRLQVGRVYLIQGQFDQAYEHFVQVADRLVEKRDGDKAASLLNQIVQKSPSHAKTLLKLVDIYRSLQKDSMVVSTYSQLTEAYIQAGQLEQAASVLEQLLQREPQNGQHKTKLDFVRKKLKDKQAPAPAAPPAPAPPPPTTAKPAAAPAEMDVEFDFPSEEPAAAPVIPPRPPAQAKVAPPPPPPAPPAEAPAAPAAAGGAPLTRPVIELSGPPSEEDKEFVEEHLAEGKVFRKYGLIDKAADQFEAVVARFPDNVDARQELRELYKEKGQNARAAEHALALAEIFRLKGDAKAAQAAESDAQRLAPELVGALGAPAAPSPAAPPDEDDQVAVEIDDAAESVAVTDDVDVPMVVDDAGGDEFDLSGAEDVVEPPVRSPVEQAGEEFDLSAGEELASGGGEEFDLNVADEVPDAPPAPPAPPPQREDFDLSAGDEFDLGGTPEPPVEQGLPELPLPSDTDDLLGMDVAPPPSATAPDDTAGMLELDEGPGLDLEPPPPPAPPPPPPPPPPPVAPLKATPARPPAPPATAVLPGDLQRVLDEADSYVSLGFVDDAKESLREIGTRYPGHPAILAKIGELGFDQDVLEEPPAAPPEAPAGDLLDELDLDAPPPAAAPPEPPLSLDDELPPQDFGMPPAESADALLADELAAPAPPPAPAGGVDLGDDLGGELDDLFSAQPAVDEPEPATGGTDLGDSSLADIFKEFKKGVDKQLGKEDYDTRYNLGIAYKEMGLIDEAIAEFQLAAKDESRLLECSSMLGICFLEKGMAKLAVKWFEKGLKAPGRSEEEYNGLRYDLASAYEADGQSGRALNIYLELYGMDANFRDVASKVRELQGGGSAPSDWN